jgi:bacterial/archaeal transporter family protein
MLKLNSDHRLLLFSFLAILMWGLWGFFGKLALERKMAPISILLAETVISAVVALPIFLVVTYKPNAQPLQSTLSIYGFLSGAGLAVGLLFYYFALSEARVAIVVPLTATYPVISVLLSFALLGERPSLAQWTGVAFVVVGVALLLTSPAKVGQ